MSLPTEATQVIFERLPEGDGEIITDTSKPDSTFSVKTVKLNENLKNGELLIKTLLLSNDPTQRTWLRKQGNNARSYIPPVYEGNVMESFGLGEVLKSTSEKYSKGDIVSGRIDWADFAIIPEAKILNKIDTKSGLPLSYYLSVLGMTSLTAFFGLTEAGQLGKYLKEKPEKGKGPIVCVSAASGAVGSTVVQISKHLLGASKVIGLAGSEEKCKWVERLGADLCVNYKDSDYQDKINNFLGDSYVDVYYDNVGGQILSFLLTKMKEFGRVAACGAISGYNDPKESYVTTWFDIVAQCITVEGFLVFKYKEKFPEAIKILSDAIKEKKIDVDDSIHIEKLKGDSPEQKLSEIPKIWNLLFNGNKPNGKLLIEVA
ncbi:uncharacterized protein KGF55_003055 [Candida pseudojiufengensis]|uniref:uncharacterized protein n=1 Tax=Candida pseudojiufengensis TaxID=497109 RepID=UPI0022254A00|nr:uncharacterized protein KGF55_003055 [Candida pseudojiufengensis]KAI5963263.1 hypothetical protein KGF55_003055 [Candida pseudojiufengensis]